MSTPPIKPIQIQEPVLEQQSSSIGSKVVSGVLLPVLKGTAQATASIASYGMQFYSWLHPCVKVPLETYLIYQYTPFTGVWKAAHLSTWAWTRLSKTGSGLSEHPLVIQTAEKAFNVVGQLIDEAPQFWNATKEAAEHLRKGDPFNVLGRRIAVTNSHPDTSQKHLENVDRNLTIFDNNQPTGLQGEIPSLSTLPEDDLQKILETQFKAKHPALPSNDPTDNSPVLGDDQIEKTNQELENFTENLSYFIPLYTMVEAADIQDSDQNAIISMVREASKTGLDGKKLSPKEVFLNRYGKNLNFFQRTRIWFYNLFFQSGIFNKTVDVYMKHILSEMRSRLSKSRWVEKEKNTKRLMLDLLHFLEVYKNATLNYAEAKNPEETGTLDKYRQIAFEKMFDKPLERLCEDFSKTLIKHLSPQVSYFKESWILPRFCNKLLNKAVKWIMGHYLPRGIHTTVLKANDATKPHHLPFAKALTDTVTEQMQKLLDEGPSPPPLPMDGTEDLGSVIENLFLVVQFSKSKDQESILAKRKEILEREKEGGFDKDINEKIQQGIRDSIFKGAQALLRHLAEPRNSEEMFTKFFKLANTPFSQGEFVTQQEFKASKNKLDLIVRKVGSKFAKEATKEAARASRPEQIEIAADQAFQSHRLDANHARRYLKLFSDSIQAKIAQLSQGWSPEIDILRDLGSMQRILQAFSTSEQTAEDLKTLEDADREGILRPLAPLYQTIEQISMKLIRLQELQKLHKDKFLVAQEFKKIDKMIGAMAIAEPRELGLGNIPPLLEAVDKIEKHLKGQAEDELKIIQEMKDKANDIKKSLDITAIQKKRQDLLKALQNQINELKSSIEQRRADRRKACLTQIRETLRQVPAEDVKKLDPLIRNFNDLSASFSSQQRAPFDAAWKLLKEETDKIYDRYEAERKAGIEALPSLDPFRKKIQIREKHYRDLQNQKAEEMEKEAVSLSSDTSILKNQIESIQRENQLHLGRHHFGIIGAGALGVIALFSPTIAATLAALANGTIEQVGPLLQGGEKRAEAATLIGTQALIAGTAAAALSNIPIIGPLLVGTGAAVGGGAAGNRALEGVIDGGSNIVEEEITKFFDQTYAFLISGDIYKPAAKITMHEIVASFENKS